MFKIIVLISGRGSNMEALAKSISANNWPIEISAVISNKAKAPGLEIAKELGIKTEFIRKGDDFYPQLIKTIKSYQPELIVLAGFMKLLPSEFIAEFENQIINIHPSLLPDFKGLNAQKQALEAGVSESGCTVHLVTAEMDAGRILAQARVQVKAEDSEESLKERILEKEHKLLPEVVYGISQKKILLDEPF